MSDTIQAVSDHNFNESVLQSELPVVVDFWAPWCGPCRQVAPIIEELSATYTGKIHFVKVNVDENQAVSQQFGIRSIPTLLFFKKGEKVSQIIGAVPKSQLEAKLKQDLL